VTVLTSLVPFVGVLAPAIGGAAYVVGSSALGGCLADEFGSEWLPPPARTAVR
jgi:hypothetical protein